MVRIHGLMVAAALLLGGVGLHAQEAPAGWKVLKDKKGDCQMVVPADWVSSPLLPGSASSADNKATAVVHGADPSQSFADATAMVKQIMKPTRIIEDSSKRLWYVYEGNGSGNGVTNWYAAVPGKPVCATQVSFKVPALEETVKKIVLSMAPAK